MPTLYVSEQNAIIRKTSDRLVLEKDGEVLMEIPCLKLETVLIYGNVQFTTQAAAEMLSHGIELSLFTTRGRLWGQVTPPLGKNVYLRMQQYELVKDEAFRLAFSREVVRSKIANSLAVLRRFRANHPGALPPAVFPEMEGFLAQVDPAPSIGALRGIEGSAAAAYFRAFGSMVPQELGFAGRERRPPPDPVNALLSFGYVLVGNEIQALLDGIGFDPYLGFYHELRYGRASLALDLLEEFRAPLVDRLTTRLLNKGILQPADFVGHPGRGIHLGQEAKKRYFREYEKELTTPLAVDGERLSFRELFRRQAERLRRALRGEEIYQPFRLPC